jgi:hypothetical protein
VTVTLVVVALAAWRTWYLIGQDDGPFNILDRARRYITGLPRDWKERDQIPDSYREGMKDFLECPFCLGFWIALAWAGLYALDDEWAFWVGLPFAVNAVTVAVNHWLTADE